MRVATKVAIGLEEREFGMSVQSVRSGQARDARADDGNTANGRGVAFQCNPPEYKNAAKRPGANEGGREEEKRPGIAYRTKSTRLRNKETRCSAASSVPLEAERGGTPLATKFQTAGLAAG